MTYTTLADAIVPRFLNPWRQWRKGLGHVLTTEVRELETGRWLLHVRYQYTHGGDSYSNSFGKEDTEEEIRIETVLFPAGATLDILVNPQKPWQAVVDPKWYFGGRECAIALAVAAAGIFSKVVIFSELAAGLLFLGYFHWRRWDRSSWIALPGRVIATHCRRDQSSEETSYTTYRAVEFELDSNRYVRFVSDEFSHASRPPGTDLTIYVNAANTAEADLSVPTTPQLGCAIVIGICIVCMTLDGVGIDNIADFLSRRRIEVPVSILVILLLLNVIRKKLRFQAKCESYGTQ